MKLYLFAFSIWLSTVLSTPPFSQIVTANHEWLSDLKRYQHENGVPKRPLNSFMCYKISYYDAIKSHLEPNSDHTLTSNDIVKATGQSWIQETPEIKEYYRKLSKNARDNHKFLFPDYTYQPVRKQKKHDSDEDGEHEVISMEEWNAL
ncbi:MAG: hypothetical protein EOP45_21655 [Sphingobacteriaceae bacterium]|nr:MAG: hypothetical protein EOP45_21655 [Sphingobacteriaceae bacterium]